MKDSLIFQQILDSWWQKARIRTSPLQAQATQSRGDSNFSPPDDDFVELSYYFVQKLHVLDFFPSSSEHTKLIKNNLQSPVLEALPKAQQNQLQSQAFRCSCEVTQQLTILLKHVQPHHLIDP